MFINRRHVIHLDYLAHSNSFDHENSNELQIDLDYNENINRGHENEPLDLTVKKVNDNDVCAPDQSSYIDGINLRYKHDFADATNDLKIPFVTEGDIALLIDPFLKNVNKKVVCTICKVKFVSKVKAKTHVENKHVDCLMYKCPLCRVTKVTRLAYESHLRRGHGARVTDYSPLIRLRKNFMVKQGDQRSHLDCRSDLEFVTFLRHILTVTGDDLDEGSRRCAEWVDQEQCVFKINNKEQFAMEWYKFKVGHIFHAITVIITIVTGLQL